MKRKQQTPGDMGEFDGYQSIDIPNQTDEFPDIFSIGNDVFQTEITRNALNLAPTTIDDKKDANDSIQKNTCTSSPSYLPSLDQFFENMSTAPSLPSMPAPVKDVNNFPLKRSTNPSLSSLVVSPLSFAAPPLSGLRPPSYDVSGKIPSGMTTSGRNDSSDSFPVKLSQKANPSKQDAPKKDIEKSFGAYSKHSKIVLEENDDKQRYKYFFSQFIIYC